MSKKLIPVALATGFLTIMLGGGNAFASDIQAHSEPEGEYTNPIDITFKVTDPYNVGTNKFTLYMPVNALDYWTPTKYVKAAEAYADADGNVTFPTFYSNGEHQVYMNPMDVGFDPVVIQSVPDGAPDWAYVFGGAGYLKHLYDNIYEYEAGINLSGYEGYESVTANLDVYHYDTSAGTPFIIDRFNPDFHNKPWKKSIDIKANINNSGEGPLEQFELFDEDGNSLGLSSVNSDGQVVWNIEEKWDEVCADNVVELFVNNDKIIYYSINTSGDNVSRNLSNTIYNNVSNNHTKNYKIVQKKGTDADYVYDNTEFTISTSMHIDKNAGLVVDELAVPTFTVNNTKMQKGRIKLELEVAQDVDIGNLDLQNNLIISNNDTNINGVVTKNGDKYIYVSDDNLEGNSFNLKVKGLPEGLIALHIKKADTSEDGFITYTGLIQNLDAWLSEVEIANRTNIPVYFEYDVNAEMNSGYSSSRFDIYCDGEQTSFYDYINKTSNNNYTGRISIGDLSLDESSMSKYKIGDTVESSDIREGLINSSFNSQSSRALSDFRDIYFKYENAKSLDGKYCGISPLMQGEYKLIQDGSETYNSEDQKWYINAIIVRELKYKGDESNLPVFKFSVPADKVEKNLNNFGHEYSTVKAIVSVHKSDNENEDYSLDGYLSKVSDTEVAFVSNMQIPVGNYTVNGVRCLGLNYANSADEQSFNVEAGVDYTFENPTALFEMNRSILVNGNLNISDIFDTGNTESIIIASNDDPLISTHPYTKNIELTVPWHKLGGNSGSNIYIFDKTTGNFLTTYGHASTTVYSESRMPLLCLGYYDGSSTNFPLVGFDKGKLTLKLGFTEPGVHELNFYCHDFDSGKIISVKDVSVFITEDDIELSKKIEFCTYKTLKFIFDRIPLSGNEFIGTGSTNYAYTFVHNLHNMECIEQDGTYIFEEQIPILGKVQGDLNLEPDYIDYSFTFNYTRAKGFYSGSENLYRMDWESNLDDNGDYITGVKVDVHCDDADKAYISVNGKKADTVNFNASEILEVVNTSLCESELYVYSARKASSTEMYSEVIPHATTNDETYVGNSYYREKNYIGLKYTLQPGEKIDVPIYIPMQYKAGDTRNIYVKLKNQFGWQEKKIEVRFKGAAEAEFSPSKISFEGNSIKLTDWFDNKTGISVTKDDIEYSIEDVGYKKVSVEDIMSDYLYWYPLIGDLFDNHNAAYFNYISVYGLTQEQIEQRLQYHNMDISYEKLLTIISSVVDHPDWYTDTDATRHKLDNKEFDFGTNVVEDIIVVDDDLNMTVNPNLIYANGLSEKLANGELKINIGLKGDKFSDCMITLGEIKVPKYTDYSDFSFSLNKKLTLDYGEANLEISKEAPAGKYGIYNSNKELIKEVETDDNDIISTIISVVKQLGETITYYIKQLEIFDDSLNVDNEFKEFTVIASPSELGSSEFTMVAKGLDEITFNNTSKQTNPSDTNSEEIEIEVDDTISETVDLDENRTDAVRAFNVLEFIYDNHDEDYFKRSLKTSGLTSKYKYGFSENKNLFFDLTENEDDADLTDLVMYTDNKNTEIRFNVPDEVQAELIDAGIVDNKLTSIHIKFNNSNSGVATGSEIPKGDSDDKKSDVATGSEIPKDSSDDKNTSENTDKSDVAKNNLDDKGTSENTNKSNTSSTKKNKKSDDDNKPAYDGDWYTLDNKLFNKPVSKAGGAKFKVWQSSLYVRNETRTLPIHGRSGEYRTYHFDKDGKLLYGWFKDPLNHQWYYFGEDGAQVYGWQFINNKWYYFNKDMKSIDRGQMLKNCTINGCRLSSDGAYIEEEVG